LRGAEFGPSLARGGAPEGGDTVGSEYGEALGEAVGSGVYRSSLPVGVLVRTGDDEGGVLSLSMSYRDGIDVKVDAGDEVGSVVVPFLFPVGLEVLATAGKYGARVSSSIPNFEGTRVNSRENVGAPVVCSGLEVMVDAGDDDGACVPPNSNFDGIGVGSRVDVGSAVTRSFFTVGLVDDVGVFRSILNCDGTDVALDIGDTVATAGDDDGAHMLPPEPKSEGRGVGSRVDVGSDVSC
jgi:hypothetical protein